MSETNPELAKPADPIEARILDLTASRGAGRSICPSEVARALVAGSPGADWRALMPKVRRSAVRLAVGGKIEILRKGKPIDPSALKGVIRLRARGA